jgi:hypothetical protein
MSSNLLLIGFSFISFIGYNQFCTVGVGPSSADDSQIKSVSLVGESNTLSYLDGCTGTIGVEDLTSLSTDLVAGQFYNLSVQFGSCGGFYNSVGEAWIDFDGSNTFESTESIGTWNGMPSATPVITVFNFQVPINALTGSTRLRITQQEGGSLPVNPCGSFVWGSVMDFSITITGGVDCSGYDGDTRADAIPIASIPFSHTHSTGFCYYNQNFVYPSPDVYYRILPTPEMGNFLVSLCGSSFDTFLSVQDASGNALLYNDDGSCGSNSELIVSSDLEDTLYIIVEGWGAQMGDYILNITPSTLETEEFSGNLISVAPNPFESTINLQGFKDESEILIFNTSGLIVHKAYSTSNKLDLSELDSGSYLMYSISKNNFPLVTKLIKL